MINAAALGYARISTDRQDTALQLDALAGYGVPAASVFTDTMSGANDNRPGLADALSALKPGGVLVVWRIDRMGRSLRHLLTIAEQIAAKARGVKLGNKPVLTGDRYDIAHRMWLAGIPASRIARDLKCCEATIYKTFPGGRGKRKARISAPSEPH